MTHLLQYLLANPVTLPTPGYFMARMTLHSVDVELRIKDGIQIIVYRLSLATSEDGLGIFVIATGGVIATL
ncbi:hypothetical protein HNY73_014410 [Argiope bruennichi]|uniref:Uncharacterized protein n=1 Tax=Argiope bruennichi TaxID=94029 RepID=A0A8T0ET20_ARGBR|nr:hypothetical protein HNY73_014410 [Argiope bruennichi]